ncbi:hypothetical protein VTJ04DRAFT_3074 [Mycothermus thermophilus]|uniref:uncharacterized protein n=1 Tax=Humicola insolens TaxID=85995 RepID=UPI003742F4F7
MSISVHTVSSVTSISFLFVFSTFSSISRLEQPVHPLSSLYLFSYVRSQNRGLHMAFTGVSILLVLCMCLLTEITWRAGRTGILLSF